MVHLRAAVATWNYINPLAAEHVEYLKTEGVTVPPLSVSNRRPTEAEVLAAYTEIGSPENLLVDTYVVRAERTVCVRGDYRAAVEFLVALAKRCGQLYMFPFPHDRMPGVVADPADDLKAALHRMDKGTRAALAEAF